MHLDAYITPCPTFGWEGGPEFLTEIVPLRNGREVRTARWDRVRHKFTAPYMNITKEDFRAIKQMHLVCRGMLHAFRWRDQLDYQADNEIFGTGDGVEDTFQLGKFSILDGVEYYREVFALVDTPVITVNGTPTTAFSVNLRTGEVVFDAPPAAAAVLRWTGEFDIWVRFNSDYLPFSLDNPDATNGAIELLEVAAPDEEVST